MISPGMLKPKRASWASWNESHSWSTASSVERVDADRQLELVVLAEIAHLQRAEDLDVARRSPAAASSAAASATSVAMISRRARRVEALAGELRRALAVDAGIGEDEAIGRELAGMVGDDAARDAHLAHQVAGVQRAGAAEGAEREVARIEAALDQHASAARRPCCCWRCARSPWRRLSTLLAERARRRRATARCGGVARRASCGRRGSCRG